jgi:hypothetical protein
MNYYFHNYPQNADNSNLFWTVITGVVVFILSQYVLELIIKPYKEYKNTKREISNKLKYYANVISNPLNLREDSVKDTNIDKALENYRNASDEIRKLSCDLESKYYDNYSWIRKLFIRDNVEEAASLLIGISNKLFTFPHSHVTDQAISNYNDTEKIKELLNMKR